MKERQSNIELLRCVLMYMIVVIHIIGHNILDSNNPVQVEAPNYISSNLLFSFCVCAVDCFVLISGFFMMKFSLKKVILFILPICFYQLLFSLFFYKIHHNLSISPFDYWFVGPYLMLLLISPILNEGLKTLNTKQLYLIIALSTLFFIVPIPSILGQAGKTFATFLYIYIIGYFLRDHKLEVNRFASLGFFVFMCLLVWGEFLLLSFFGKNNGTSTLSYNYDNILIIMAAVFLFQTFRKITFKSKFVNWVASSSFFVYIISENKNMYNHPGLYDLLNVSKWSDSSMYVFHVLFSSAVIFFCAIAIDKLRLVFFSRFEKKIGNWLEKYDIYNSNTSSL